MVLGTCRRSHSLDSPTPPGVGYRKLEVDMRMKEKLRIIRKVTAARDRVSDAVTREVLRLEEGPELHLFAYFLLANAAAGYFRISKPDEYFPGAMN